MPGWGVIPAIRVPDVAGALAFYRDVLGFDVERDDPQNSVVTRGDARLMVEPAGEHYSEGYNVRIRERLGARSPNALYIEAPDLDELDRRLRAAGATVVDPLAARPWGQRELTVEDPSGNWLTFWTSL
jgi:catechol 2,3-dioxygenase-like lactoylglutathione lyase family enzyme